MRSPTDTKPRPYSEAGSAPARKMMKARGFTKPGMEVHHTIPLKGKSRTAQDWRAPHTKAQKR